MLIYSFRLYIFAESKIIVTWHYSIRRKCKYKLLTRIKREIGKTSKCKKTIATNVLFQNLHQHFSNAILLFKTVYNIIFSAFVYPEGC